MVTIEIRIRTLAQLFDSLDPSPFPERGLNRDAASYIVDCAAEHSPNETLRLLIHVPDSVRPHVADATQAIRSHFRFAHTHAQRRHRGRMRTGRALLLLGSVVMVVTVSLRALLDEWLSTPIGQGLGEGLLILGWVVLWRPTELLLFERWENRQERHLLDRLAKIPVEFAFFPGNPA